MSGLGTMAPEHLEKVRELHGSVRKWIEDSASAQGNEHIRENLPYVDLMFAFGFATLGDAATANKLTEDARRVLEGPIPAGGSPQADQAVTAAIVRQFMFKAFRYRVEQALAGKPHGGPLSAEALNAREEMAKKGGSGPVNNPYKLAAFVIDKFRQQSRVIEPEEKVDPYASWDTADPLMKEVAELHLLRDPAQLAERIRKLCKEGLTHKPIKEVQFYTLREALPLAPRVGEAFTMELLALVPTALFNSTGTSPDLPKKQGELLERALLLAGHFNRVGIVKQLVDDFTALVHSKPRNERYSLINVVSRQCLWGLKRFGLTTEIDRFLNQLYNEVLADQSVAGLRQKHSAKPEEWAAALQTLLHLAGGWMQLGNTDRAKPIVEEARNELLNPSGIALQPKDYTELARAYVAALSQVPSTEQGLAGLIELFRKMSPAKISNTWTTAQYYSRFHLNLVEDTVLAVLPLAPENPVPAIVSQ